MATTIGSKQPYEEYFITFDFANYLGVEHIATAAVTAADEADGTDKTATVTTAGYQTITDTTVNVWVKGGTTAHKYKITCKIVGASGSKYELDAILPVMER
jgi:hypothetical protein